MNPTTLESIASDLVSREVKIGGLTTQQLIQILDNAAWFEAREDSGQRRLLYLYLDSKLWEAHRATVRGFQTSFEEEIDCGESKLRVFVNTGEHRIIMPESLRKHLISPSTMPSEINDYEVEHVLGSGYKGVTFRVHKKNGLLTPYALKLTIPEEYQGMSYGAEVDRMVDLSEKDRNHFPQIFECDKWICHSFHGTPELIVFVEEFIPGTTLGKFLESRQDILSVRFLEEFVREMLKALVSLQECELMHDDLHVDNIMLCNPLADCRPKLIDFGSTKPIKASIKERDDIRNFASHTARMVNYLEARSNSRTGREEHVLKACEGMLAKISDKDPMRRPDDAIEILEHFETFFQRGEVKQTLQRPFDFGNAEEILDNALLYDLAAKRFPWRDRIESSANLLIIGPRGCGKTTVFRSMSFNCLADAGRREEVLSKTYIGLYISCNKDFRLRFSALDRELIARRATELRHYFNLLVAREFVTTLIACHNWGELGRRDVKVAQQFFYDRVGIQVAQSANQGSILSDIKSAVVRLIDETRTAIIDDVSVKKATEQSFVADLAALANNDIMLFLGKVLYLFVDDYTEGKVPKEAQKILNHILFVPNAFYKTKIASEVFGFIVDQTFSTFLDQDRDYKELNLGTLYYANLPSKQQKAFLEEIIDKRLELCGYGGQVQDVIGPSEYYGGTLGRALRREAELRQTWRDSKDGTTPAPLAEEQIEIKLQQEGGGRVYYHGWDTICQLCTGDISNILEILSRIYDQCGVEKGKRDRVPPNAQSSVIETYSRQYIQKMKAIPQHGESLFEIVNAFGSMSAELLGKREPINRGGGRRDPYQLIRIEMDEGGAIRDSLYEDSDVEPHIKLWTLLQRYSIFIDSEESRSRRNTLASKVILRRIFCPAFKIALANSESYTISQQEWAAFCTDPKGTATRYVRRELGTARDLYGKQYDLPFDRLS